MTRLTAQAYTVAWLCALPLSELVVATAMLDEEHDRLSLSTYDENSYTYGSINGHNVVIACMPPGQPGKVSASKLVQPLCQSFPNLKIHLFVGIGGGVPRIPRPDDPEKDIHLGDVVIGWAEQTGVPGVVQWDLVRYLEDGNTEPLGILDKPDRRLLNALGLLLAKHKLGKTKFPEHLTRLRKLSGFSHPGLEHDILFKSTYHHVRGPNCSYCDHAQFTERRPRVNQDLIFHQGTIVSGDTVMKNPQRRDEISQLCYGALCFEMEAAGVMDDKHCLVIRGIANYADSHENGSWKNYAAGTAAAFARELLFKIRPQEVNGIESIAKVHFMVPFQRNGDLIGREVFIRSLETKLCVPNKYCRVALVGLGGIGKTRIALEYASKFEKSDSMSVFWVHASTAEQMGKAYQEIAKEARLCGAEDPKVDQIQLVKQWLESKDSGNWVMIIDNADDEKLFFGEDEGRTVGPSTVSGRLAYYFPRRPNGSILLTTRNKKLGVKFADARLSNVITIPEMSILESKSLLFQKLGEENHDDNDLTELVEVLENLPLALIQAAAFIGENSQSIIEYLRTFRRSDLSKITLLSQNFEDSERHPDIKNPVAATWEISFKQIRRNNHRAAELLSLMSVLHWQAIPRSILSSDADEVEFEKSLGTLKAYSLITQDHSRQVGGESEVKCTGRRPEFNLHRLVHLATRNWMNMNEELDFWTQKALVLLSEHFPDPGFENQEIWMAYLPHARIVLNSNRLPAGEDIVQATLLYNVSRALEQKGDYDPAEVMAQKSLDLREKVLGKKHVDTLHSLSNLGSVLASQGKNEKAEKICRQALNGSEEILGKEDLCSLRSLSELGFVLAEQGKYEEAEKLHRQALSISEKTQRKEHPQTLESVSNLALLLDRQGQYQEAEKLDRRVLNGREKTLGKEHPDTLISVSNLALVLDNQGKYETAEELHRRALSDKEKILGIDHPSTLTSVDNLALVLSNQGKYEEAEKLHRQALSISEKTQRKEHPQTLRSVNNLALVLSNQGKYQEAEKLHRPALSAKEKILGKEHPDTLTSVHNLALVLEDQGKYQEAESLFRRALSGREKTLGKEHPDTLTSVNNLAIVISHQGKYEEAESLHRRALSGREKTLGKEHPETFVIVWSLACLLDNRLQYQDALPLYQKACAGLEKTLGSNHPWTQDCVRHYSEMLEKMERDSATESGSAIDTDS